MTSSALTSCTSPYAPASRSRSAPSPARRSFSAASGLTFPVSSDWRIPAAASAAMASEAPGSGRTGPGTVSSAATRSSAARNGPAAETGTPAIASVSPMMARSVRPAFGAT